MCNHKINLEAQERIELKQDEQAKENPQGISRSQPIYYFIFLKTVPHIL